MGDAIRTTAGSMYGTPSDDTPILLDEVNCTGHEYQLSDCPHLGWLTHDCTHHENAGVECQGSNTHDDTVLHVYRTF